VANRAEGGRAKGGRKGGGDKPQGLTNNERLVWQVLMQAKDPMKAYDILARLRENGVQAPMTVYRALEGLEEKGVVHKLDGMSSYVLCNHEGPHEMQAFLVCNNCSTATEFDIDALATGVAPALKRTGFAMHSARLEVRGLCDQCARSAA
jgi:Fur family zinc uptake transcriptional regulator